MGPIVVTNLTPNLWIGDKYILWENPFKYVNALKPSDSCSTYLKSFFFVWFQQIKVILCIIKL